VAQPQRERLAVQRLSTPAFFVPDYAPWREFGREFINACHVTRGEKVEAQTEGEAVAEQTPTAGYLSGALKTLAGEVIVSQQLLDRAGPNFKFDSLIFDQLNRRYALEADSYVLKEVLAVATSQEWSGSSNEFVLYNKGSKPGGFIGQVVKAKASIRTTAGTVLNPTHLFLRADRWEQISAMTDENARPLVNAIYQGPYAAFAGGPLMVMRVSRATPATGSAVCPFIQTRTYLHGGPLAAIKQSSVRSTRCMCMRATSCHA
jgi:hypothetical protein